MLALRLLQASLEARLVSGWAAEYLQLPQSLQVPRHGLDLPFTLPTSNLFMHICSGKAYIKII